jgi:integrase
MSAKSCLQRRETGNYYFRKKIPAELRSVLDKREIVKSLKTTNYHQATKIALQLENYIEQYFEKIRLGQPVSIYLIESCTVTNSGKIIFGEDDNLNYTLKDVLQKWIKSNRPSDSAIAEWKLALRQFAELYGDIEISKITTLHIIKYRELISALPARYNVKHPGLTLHEVRKIYYNKEVPEPVANTTLLKRIGALKSLLAFAKNEGLILTSPADNIKLKGGRNSLLIRKCFSREDLTSIFNPLAQYNSHKYWIPLIALYTGARLEELGQLEVTDLKQEGGLYYLDINSVGRKRLKTKASARRILDKYLQRISYQ